MLLAISYYCIKRDTFELFCWWIMRKSCPWIHRNYLCFSTYLHIFTTGISCHTNFHYRRLTILGIYYARPNTMPWDPKKKVSKARCTHCCRVIKNLKEQRPHPIDRENKSPIHLKCASHLRRQQARISPIITAILAPPGSCADPA